MTLGTRWLRAAVVALAVLGAGWMAVDGLRALITGEYFTPSSGDYAGRLGPWAAVVAALGVDPLGAPMKLFFVGYGLAWLAATAAFVRRIRGSWAAMAGFASGSLWYLVAGTVSSIVQLGLLLVLRRRERTSA